MWLIKNDVGIPLDSMIDAYDNMIGNYPAFWPVPHEYRGWSIQSHSGEVADGWQRIANYRDQNGTAPESMQMLIDRGFTPDSWHTNPTPLYNSVFGQLIDSCNSDMLVLFRSRVLEIAPGVNTGLMCDALHPGDYAARIIVPLITSTGFNVIDDDNTMHSMSEAGNMYLIDTSKHFQLVNFSSNTVVVFMARVIDRAGSTPLPAPPAAETAWLAERQLRP